MVTTLWILGYLLVGLVFTRICYLTRDGREAIEEEPGLAIAGPFLWPVVAAALLIGSFAIGIQKLVMLPTRKERRARKEQEIERRAREYDQRRAEETRRLAREYDLPTAD